MIKKRAYGILFVLFLGLIESFIYDLYGYQILTFFFLTAILIIGADIWILNHSTFKSIRNLEVKRRMERTEIKKGDSVKVELIIHNPNVRTVEFEYFDTLADIFTLSGKYSGREVIKAKSTLTLEYSISPEAIGKYKVGPLKIIANDGLGLAYIEFVANQVETVRIGPSSKDTYMQRSERLSNVLFMNGIHISKKAGLGYNFFGLRAYNESDEMRRVAWNRYNIYGNEELFVKEFEEERQIDVIIVLDYSIGSNLGFGGKRIFDFMVTTSINATYTILKNQDRVGFVIISSEIEIYIKPSSRNEAINTLQRTVSDIRPSGTFNIGIANNFIRKNIKKNAMIFMLLSPNSAKDVATLTPSDLRMDKQEYVYVISSRSFYNIPSDRNIELLGHSLLDSEDKTISTNVKFFRKFGLVARFVKSETTLPVLLTDYANGRDANRGA